MVYLSLYQILKVIQILPDPAEGAAMVTNRGQAGLTGVPYGILAWSR
jgi:hypothetical protein